ncbi:MAG: single-stranded-DNA-specific exonuclease RecJ [Clostridia bacterium]|jgi:single-stranded-DNA-specific exonuclease|nr:single-stranded-DNA-specific exonuclease RecJ [Clostridia bacterium]
MKFIKKNSNVCASDVNKFATEFNISPIIIEQIIARGNDSAEKIAEFLNPSQKSYHNPFLLKGMTEFVERIKIAIQNKEKILVFGDYDVDGINATVIMIKTLNILGCNSPKFYLPNRYTDGYGLTSDVIDKIKNKYNPTLIITVDCGISCHKEVEYAKKLGIEIIVTDHHEIPETIPNGIVLNAKLPNQEYPFKELCGTGLVYKISQALLGAEAEQFLPIACIATIADIVPLLDENRAIVAHGLKKLNFLPLGVKELFKTLNIKLNKCTVNDISFKLAPKLNAAGRMGNAKDSLELYFAENIQTIQILINKIINHNIKRQNLCVVVERDCEAELSKMNMSRTPCIILYSTDWDHGILGIVCAKLVAKYNRPVFLFSKVNGILKGSARSIPSINIHELLSTMSDILETYGGHPIAAGMTLKIQNFSTFIEKVNDFLFKNYIDDIFSPYEEYDAFIKVNDLTPKLMKDVLKLEPCGCGNIMPRFMIRTSDFSFLPMKNHINHCNFKINNTFDLVYFNHINCQNKIKKAKKIDFIFELQKDSFSSRLKGIVKAVNCNINDLKPFTQNFVFSQLEQLKYLNIKTPTQFSYFSENAPMPVDTFKNIEKKYGTAFVVNSEKGLSLLKKIFNIEKIDEIDIYDGKHSSGINCVFICPESLDFARNYDKIILLDNVVHLSYIAKINQISDAKVYVINLKNDYNLFYSLDTSRENFGKIFKDLERFSGQYANIYNIFEKNSKSKKMNYSYVDFYCAFLVFQELKIISFKKSENIESVYILKIDKAVKSSLNNSQIYKTVEKIKNSLFVNETEIVYKKSNQSQI